MPRKRKKARPARPGTASAADSDTPRRKVRMSLEALEVTRGHDGLLRGKPEAALLVAAYRTNGLLPASLLARALVRVQPKSELPCSVSLEQRELRYDARFAATERIAVLVFALEEDSGDGVAALYAALETSGQFLLYSAAESVPSPLTLDEWARHEHRAPAAQPVEVLFGGATLEKTHGLRPVHLRRRIQRRKPGARGRALAPAVRRAGRPQ
jgi:hypothetical protein